MEVGGDGRGLVSGERRGFAVQELRDATCPGCGSYRNAGGLILSQNRDFISE